MKHSVCLLNDSFPPMIDGVSNTVVNYANIIEKNHGRALVVTPSVPGADDSGYEYPVIRYPSIDTRKLVGYVLGYPFSPETARAVSDENVQILHTHCPVTSALLARQLAESMNLPLVLTWHTKFDIDIAKAVKNKLLQGGAMMAFLRNVNACDEIWTVSKGAGENLRTFGYEGDYIVMPNGVDLPRETVSQEVIREATAGYDLPDDVPSFLFIGRMMWYKGLKIILDALARLDEEGADYRMIFVGGGADLDDVKEYSRSLNLTKRVFFTGPISDRVHLRGWYSRADLFIFPSTYDTNGLVVREAAASDTAAVIIEGSCAAEGVTDGRNGFLIEENAVSLATKLKELIEKPDVMKAVGKGAGDELYISWEDAVARACDRYEIVIDKFKRGDYGSHDPIRGSWMQSQGELMQVLGDVGAVGKGIKSSIESAQSELEMSMRSIRNKALTEIIATSYEVKENISSLGAEAKENLSSAAQSIWEKLDRYL